jgi:hypothetical protein
MANVSQVFSLSTSKIGKPKASRIQRIFSIPLSKSNYKKTTDTQSSRARLIGKIKFLHPFCMPDGASHWQICQR